MLGKITPASEHEGIKYWMHVEGIFRKSIRVYRVVGTSDMGTVVHFEDVRTKYPHRRHVSMLLQSYFKPFLIPGGKKNA